MTELHQALSGRVGAWRDDGHRHNRFPAISEILGYAFEDDEARQLRYLRAAQFRALETYWYLRLVEGTPHVADLYERCFERVTDRLTALGLAAPDLRDLATDYGYPALIERIRTDDDLARRHRLDALRETLSLNHPSWILALAMGSGKTVLIGAIVATEFAMAIEYPDAADDDHPFIENALVFAPGTTILEALRELSRVPFERILPPRLYERFAPSLKVTYTRDGPGDDVRELGGHGRGAFGLWRGRVARSPRRRAAWRIRSAVVVVLARDLRDRPGSTASETAAMTGARDRSYPGLARFEPHLEALPEIQRAVWPRLVALPPDAVLYGGTALALRLRSRPPAVRTSRGSQARHHRKNGSLRTRPNRGRLQIEHLGPLARRVVGPVGASLRSSCGRSIRACAARWWSRPPAVAS